MTSIYASPRQITELSECYFYHTDEFPDIGLVKGEWDLRAGVDNYIGNIDLERKRVLELGTASGFLCFEMERRGADVVAYDLSENDAWDIEPYGGQSAPEILEERKKLIRKINNAWWFTHHLRKSDANVVYGNIYNLPPAIGPVDIATFGSILLHLRDPFLALQKAAGLVRESIVVTEAVPVFQRTRALSFLIWLGKLDQRIATYLIPTLNFLPDPDRSHPWDTWWNLSPELVIRFLKILGFPKIQLSYHEQTHNFGKDLEHSRQRKMFTVIGSRDL